jgi:raffinose/stachyose/melibiose transport system substrate-binding protein
MRRQGLAGALAVVLALTGCSGGGEPPPSGGAIEGEITVLTQRTDIVDTIFQQYKKTFEAKYPKVTVKFEALTDYEGEIRIRMNTTDYGDVLLISGSVQASQYATFFEPLGTVDEMKSKYRFVTERSFEGKVYGLALGGNVAGFVINKKIWQQAGVTAPPTTPQEFLAALQSIKDKTGAIPLYTNYKDGWPLAQWESNRGAISADPDHILKLSQDDAPWAPGKDHYVYDSLLYDAVKAGLTETDPTTTNWEASKGQLGTGKIATMMLGSWAISQMQGAATDKADIGYLPFPTQVNGKFHSVVGGDYQQAINVNSQHKAAARAWIDWFTNESNYALDQGSISTLVNAPFPTTLADFQAAEVQLIELTPEPRGREGMADKIDKSAEIGLWEPKYRQRLVDSARGATKESKEDIFADLNRRWAAAKAKVG